HLADLGAEVIHFERPQGGDLGRGVRSIKALPVGDWNQYFLVINRNKKSMAVDLNKPEGRQIMHRLVEKSDVFLSNLSTSALEKWGCSYEELSRINPRLVYAIGSGYGPFGTISKPSFDMTVQALTGIMARLGEPGQPPIYLGMGSGDAMGGLMMALGVMLALLARERTGRGQFIDASLYGAQLFMAAPTLQAYLATRDERYMKQRSRRSPDNPLWNTYRAADKWIVLCVPNEDGKWRALCEALGAGELSADERFATSRDRRERAEALVAELDRVFASRPAAEWIERLRAAGLAATDVRNFAELEADEQAWANDYFVRTHCSEVNREVTVRGLPITFSKTPGEVRSLGPELGQDTELLLVETLGYTWEQVGELKAAGAIL
ncbi:MAG: CoA transferase, partial [Candidatus Dadabacteria bacterium]